MARGLTDRVIALVLLFGRPTVGWALDQSTIPFALSLLLFLSLQAPYPQAHTSVPSAPAIFDKLVIEVGAIRQEHIGKGAPILVETVSLERDLFSEDQL